MKGNSTLCEMIVDRNFGNHVYKMLKASKEIEENLMDQVFLLHCIYCNEFDYYSDIYKDLYNVRPHITQAQWDLMVKHLQEEVTTGAA